MDAVAAADQVIPATHWAWNFGYINLLPFRRHVFLLVGDGSVDLWTARENMQPNWTYEKSRGHGNHTFALGCTRFRALFRFSGTDADSLIELVFDHDGWLSAMFGMMTYVGRFTNPQIRDQSSRPIAMVVLSGWCRYEPNPQSRVLEVIADNQLGWRMNSPY